jgi:phage terminase large subunit GpA-like protein
MAWEDDFTGYLVDYGTYPDQHRAYFLLREVRRTLADAAKAAGGAGVGMEGAIYAGLETLSAALAAREFLRDDGTPMRIDRIMIDANWGQTTSLVKQFCRMSPQAALLLPSHGHYYGARHKPLSQYEKKRGERLDRDYMWHIPQAQPRQVRHIVWDTNWWKSFAHARLGVAMGDRGCVSLFASHDHRLLADHLTAETPTQTEGHGRKLDEWEQRPGTDNHWFDCLVGAMVGAAEQGCKLSELSHGGAGRRRDPKAPRRRYVTFAERKAERERRKEKERTP